MSPEHTRRRPLLPRSRLSRAAALPHLFLQPLRVELPACLHPLLPPLLLPPLLLLLVWVLLLLLRALLLEAPP